MNEKLIDDFLKNWETKIAIDKKSSTLKTYRTELMLFANWLDEWIENLDEASKGTISEKLAGRSPLEDVPGSTLKDYFKELKKENFKDATIRKKYTIIKAFLEYRENDSDISRIRVRTPRERLNIAPSSLTKKQANALLHAFEMMSQKKNEKAKRKKRMTKEAQYKSTYLRDKAILTVFIFCGLRVFELQKLDRFKSDKDHDYIEWSDKRTKGLIKTLGKRDIYREIPFDSIVANTINDYLETRDDSDPALFLSNFGKRISIRSIQNMVQEAGKLIGIDDLHCHQLRHTFGVLGAKIYSVNELAELLGHRNLSTTLIYTKPHISELGKKGNSLLDEEE